MSKEEIKELLREFFIDYDTHRWSNDSVYEKYIELLYKPISDLEAKLAEKDKMIEELRDYAENTTDYWVRKNIKEKEIHKQVCDEIRQAFNKEDFWLYGDNNKIISIREDKFFEILDQIEQAKEK